MTTWTILAVTLGPTICVGLGYWLGFERGWVKGYAAGATDAYEAKEGR